MNVRMELEGYREVLMGDDFFSNFYSLLMGLVG